MKVRLTSNHYGLYRLGYICATMINDNKKLWRELEQNFKNYYSSDCSLKLKSMKSESLVIVDQNATVN